MTTVSVGPHEIEVSHPDKVMFPEAGLTKADLVAYYQRVADHMLHHVGQRPVALERFPDGIDADGFLQKKVGDHFPEFVDRVELPTEDGTTVYPVINNAATLVYLAQQGTVTVHAWPSRQDHPNHPDRVIFDLDPGDEDLTGLRSTAVACRDVLADVGLSPFVKSSGSSGLHIEAPLDRTADFDEVRAFAQQVAQLLAAGDPDRVTVAHRKNQRGGRLFVDTNRNAYAQHAAAAYTVRARPGAPVATPLDWDEATSSGFDPQRYTITNIFRRLSQKTDPWEGFQDAAVGLDGARRRLERHTA